MSSLGDLMAGFGLALSWEPLFYCFIGVTLGTFVGVLPGIGALSAIALLLPFTFALDPTLSIIMLAGIWYGTQYGGSTAAILLNLPGTPSSAVACIDGYPMAQQGRAGVALFTSCIGSFIGGIFGIVLLVLFAPSIARFALRFSAPEYFSLMVLGLVAAALLVQSSPFRGAAALVFGLLLGLVGTDVTTGYFRYTFGNLELTDGLSLIAVAMGLFGVAEVAANAGKIGAGSIRAKDVGWRSLVPSRDDVRRSILPIARGSGIGAGLGALPGAGPAMASFVSYAVEKRLARDPSRFGKGAIEGVAAPETANNAAAQTAFIPMLSLGIPGDAVTALIMGALIIHGIPPGPRMLTEHAPLFWGVVASFFVGNVMLLILNLPLIGIWVRLLLIPYRVLFPAIIVFLCIGVYSVHNSSFDVLVTLAFGLIGVAMVLLRFDPVLLLLGFVLGPLMEENLRRALLISYGDATVFFTRPISSLFLALAALIVLRVLWVDVGRGLFGRGKRAAAAD